MEKKFLDPRPARELTSREVAKILGGLLGGLSNVARPERIRAALEFYTHDKHADAHRCLWASFYQKEVAEGRTIPDQDEAPDSN